VPSLAPQKNQTKPQNNQKQRNLRNIEEEIAGYCILQTFAHLK
jgi:hypothetical protein